MSARLKAPKINLRAAVEALTRKPVERQYETFWFSGDGSETDFVLPAGWVPKQVFDAGSLQKEGIADEYTVATVHGISTVTFAVAPLNLNDVAIFAELSL